MVLIEKGKTILHPSVKFESKIGCGLIPFNGAVKLHTRGLKWNLGNYATDEPRSDEAGELEFGSFISTSNELVSDSLQVMCDKPIFWVSSRKGSQD